MSVIHVAPRAVTAPSVAAGAPAVLSAEVKAFLAALPPLPPLLLQPAEGNSGAANHDAAHNDPLLFTAGTSPAATAASQEGEGAAPVSVLAERRAAAARARGLHGAAAMQAAASPSGARPGYDFAWTNPPDQDLLCVICSLVCRDAVETSCSHLFCSSCLARWLAQKSECVTCRTSLKVVSAAHGGSGGQIAQQLLASSTPFEASAALAVASSNSGAKFGQVSPAALAAAAGTGDVRASGFLRRKILGLSIACVHGGSGNSNHSGGLCTWQGELRYLSSHLRRECAMQRLIHRAQTFVDEIDGNNSSSSSNAAAAAASGGVAFPASSSSSSSSHDVPRDPKDLAALFASDYALALGAFDRVFPSAVLRALPLRALWRLAVSLGPFHSPLRPDEEIPGAGVARSIVLDRHWSAANAGLSSLPALQTCFPGPGGRVLRGSNNNAASFNLAGRMPHVCRCNSNSDSNADDGASCIMLPSFDDFPALAEEHLPDSDPGAEEAASRALESFLRRSLCSSRARAVHVRRLVRSEVFARLPVKLLPAFLASKGLRGSEAFQGPAGVGVEKSHLLDACVKHRNDDDHPEAHLPGFGFGVPPASGGAAASSSSSSGGAGAGGASSSSYSSYESNLARGAAAFDAQRHGGGGGGNGGGAQAVDPTAAARLLMQIHSSLQLAAAGLGGDADDGNGNDNYNDPFARHVQQHAAAHANASAGLASQLHGGGGGGQHVSVSPFGAHGVMLTVQSSGHQQSSSSSSATYPAPGERPWWALDRPDPTPYSLADMDRELEAERARQRAERERNEELAERRQRGDNDGGENGADPPRRRDPATIYLAQAMMAHALQHRLAAEARLAALDEEEERLRRGAASRPAAPASLFGQNDDDEFDEEAERAAAYRAYEIRQEEQRVEAERQRRRQEDPAAAADQEQPGGEANANGEGEDEAAEARRRGARMDAMRQMVAEQRAQLAAAQAVAAVREDRAERDAAAAAAAAAVAPVSAPASAPPPAPAASSSSSPRRAGSNAAVADSNGSSALMGPGPLFTARTAAAAAASDATAAAEKKPYAAPPPQNHHQQALVESEGLVAQGPCCSIM